MIDPDRPEDPTTPRLQPSLAEQRVRAVRRRMATAVLPPLPDERLGSVTLLPHQRRAAARLHRLLDVHGGALLADAVGLGKTYTALAVARRYDRAVVLAPAGLVAMWQAALLRTVQPDIAVHSLHRASRRPPHAFSGDDSMARGRTLVIIDEAHALRNGGTARYRHVSRALVGCDVLLLSATPLHNSPRDLRTLFALFLGRRQGGQRGLPLTALVVRREHLASDGAAVGAAAPPRVRSHPPRIVPQDDRTLEQLLRLPAPLPARDGAVAGALIRLGLLRAWCSSDAALSHAINRRLQRGSAMRDVLAGGRHPTARELQSWLIGSDRASEMQLGFAELLVEQAAPSDGDLADMLVTLDRHCDALRGLKQHHATTARADAVRAAFLRRVCEHHPDTPVVAFSQHARTVHALFRALADIAGVGLLTSRHAQIASGRVSRPELLGYFAPRAQSRPPPPAALVVRLLLATDLIAEGVNLQDAGVVVHLDLPWTHAVYTQRTGRAARLGSPHPVVHSYRLQASASARRALRLEARVARKALLAARLIGGATPFTTSEEARPAAGVPEWTTRWFDRLETWAWSDQTPLDSGARDVRVASIPARGTDGGAPVLALVLVRTAAGAQLLAVACRSNRVWVSSRTDALFAVSDGRCPHRCVQRWSPLFETAEGARIPRVVAARAVARGVRRWLAHRDLLREVGMRTPAGPYPSRHHGRAEPLDTGSAGRGQRRALQRLRQLVASWSPVVRRTHHAAIADAHRCILAARGAGAEDALQQWVLAAHVPPSEALAGWRHIPLLVRAIGAERPANDIAANDIAAAVVPPAASARIEACLFVR